MSGVPIPVRLTVGKGVSKEVSKDFWRKIYYKLEIDIQVENLEDVEKYRAKTEEVIDKWISMHTGQAKTSTFRPANNIPKLDIAEINELPWKGKGDSNAQRGGWGWIFSDVKGVIDRHPEKDRPLIGELGRAIRGSNNNLQLGDMIYCYAKNTDFFNRKPAKKDSAR